MNRKPLVAVLSAFLFLLMGVYLWGVPTYGEPAPGVLHGTTLDARGLAVPQVQVTIHSIDENADQVVVSDRQGSFVVGNLKPGHYQVVAAKQGGASSQVTYLAVAAGDDLRFDMRLGETAPAGAAASPSSAPAAPAAADPEAPSPLEKELAEMKARIAELEAALKPAAAPAAAPAPAPESPTAYSSSSSSSIAMSAQGQAPATAASPSATPAPALPRRISRRKPKRSRIPLHTLTGRG